MQPKKRIATILLILFALGLPIFAAAKEKPAVRERITEAASPVMWRDPGDIGSRNLFYGPGGKEHAPRGTFTFDKEDLKGTNPKFVVRGQDGRKWKVKLGNEARPETVASRIVWAVGYYTNEDYFMPDLHVQGMPAHLHRGQKLIGPDGSVHNVRMKRESAEEKKSGNWKWRRDPFTDTHALNGLRVMMALIDNWDLKDENNAVYQEDGERIYMVSDLGASFGTAGRSWPGRKAKGNFDSYRRSRFIRKVRATTVDFQVPARPSIIYFFGLKEYWQRVRMEGLGRNIPREDARWIGGLLARLSGTQIRDAFRAAGYSPREADGFAKVLESRIAVLKTL